MSHNRSKGSALKGAPIPVFRFTSSAQWQTFFTTEEEYFNSSHPENCVSRNIGRSTFSVSPRTQLLETDLDCAAVQNSSEFSFLLPRQGEAYSTCGTIKVIHKTLYDGCTDILYHHCDRPECPCPYCSDHLLSRDSWKAAERLTEMSMLYYTETNTRLGWPKHVVFSGPQDEAIAACSSPDDFKDYRTFGMNLMKNAGAVGGMFVVHMFRIVGEPADCDDLEENPARYAPGGIVTLLMKAGYGIGTKNGSKGSLWDGIFADALGLGSAYRYVYLSPHFHAHIYGHLQNSRVFFNSTNWIYKNKGARKSEKALAASIAYTLSHATRLEVLGIPVTKAVSWFGVMAYNKGGVTEIKGDYVPKTCDHGHAYHEAAINDPSLIYDEIWVREIKRYYRLNTKTKPPPSAESGATLPSTIFDFDDIPISELNYCV